MTGETGMQDRFETFTSLIAKIGRNIRRIKNSALASYNLRSQHISVLYYLFSGENLTATDLCDRTKEDKSTISRALDYLESRGYLVCESRTAKRYKSPLVLTDKGRDVGRKISDTVNRVLDEAGAGLTEEDRVILYRSLSTVSENLEKIIQTERTVKEEKSEQNGRKV